MFDIKIACLESWMMIICCVHQIILIYLLHILFSLSSVCFPHWSCLSLCPLSIPYIICLTLTGIHYEIMSISPLPFYPSVKSHWDLLNWTSDTVLSCPCKFLILISTIIKVALIIISYGFLTPGELSPSIDLPSFICCFVISAFTCPWMIPVS